MATLAEIKKAWKHCGRCPLHATRTNVVVGAPWPATGRKGLRVMVVYASPSREDDMAAKPMVGVAGEILRRNYLDVAGVKNAFITTAIGCRTVPSRRQPNQFELTKCGPRVEALVEMFRPQAFVLVGDAEYAPVAAPFVRVVHPSELVKLGWPNDATRRLAAEQAVLIRALLPPDPSAKPIDSGVAIPVGAYVLVNGTRIVIEADAASGRFTSPVPR